MTGPEIRPRRNSPRIKVPPVEVAYLNFRSGNTGIILDVSPSGLGFQAVEPVEINQSQPFAISAPGSRPIYAFGRVAWLDETRKRGGLRVIVPVAERRAFQLWQQQCLGAISSGGQMVWSQRGAGAAPLPEGETKQSRTGRNVLAGCLILALYVTAIGGWHLLASMRSVRSVLAHLNPSTATAQSEANTPKTSQDASRPTHTKSRPTGSGASDNHSAVKRSTRRHGAQLSASAGALTQHSSSKSSAQLIRAAQKSAAPRMDSGSAKSLAADLPTESATHTASAEVQDSEPLAQSSNQVPVPSELQPTPRAPGYSLSAHTPAPAAQTESAASDRVVAKPSVITNSYAPAAAQKSAAMAGDSAAKPRPAAQAPAAVIAATFEPCQLVSSIQPTYPNDARRQKIEGDVKLRVVVGTDGTVKSISPVGGPPLLVAAAMDATRQFHYKPAVLNGQPIETIQTIDIAFKLQR